MNQAQIQTWSDQLRYLSPELILRWAHDTFGDGLTAATSLGAEDQVITHMIASEAPRIPLFMIDTGRLFEETHQLLEQTRAAYSVQINTLFPDAADVEAMVGTHGPTLFRNSVELRQHCCFHRKVLPLKRALAGKRAWITGLRREQSPTRSDIGVVSWDEGNQLVKINPLWDWEESRIHSYLQQHDVPYNPLHDKGFNSIGCAPCTRAVQPGEDSRAGRWWWEQPQQKECGIHIVDGKIIRLGGPQPVAPI